MKCCFNSNVLQLLSLSLKLPTKGNWSKAEHDSSNPQLEINYNKNTEKTDKVGKKIKKKYWMFI